MHINNACYHLDHLNKAIILTARNITPCEHLLVKLSNGNITWAQAWLLVLLVLMARASATARLSLTMALAAMTAAALPGKLWRPQLRRLGTLGALIFVFTAIGAGTPPYSLQLTLRSPSSMLERLCHWNTDHASCNQQSSEVNEQCSMHPTLRGVFAVLQLEAS